MIDDWETEREQRADDREFAAGPLCDPRVHYPPGVRLPIQDFPLWASDETYLHEASTYTLEQVDDSRSQYVQFWWQRAQEWSSPEARANQILDALEIIWNVSSN